MKKSPASPEVAGSSTTAPRRGKKASAPQSDSKKKSVPKKNATDKPKTPKKQSAASNAQKPKSGKESTVEKKIVESKTCKRKINISKEKSVLPVPQTDSPTPEKDIPTMISFNSAPAQSDEISSTVSLKKSKRSHSGSKGHSAKGSRKAKKSRKAKSFPEQITFGYESEIDLELEDNPFSDDDLNSFEEIDTLLNDPKNDFEEEEFSVPEPVVVSKGPRKKVARRRQIDPTTCERDYSAEEIEFMNALDEYKRSSGRMFPTCSEILEVLLGLGYVKPVFQEEAENEPSEVFPAPASREEEPVVAAEPLSALAISIYLEEDLVICSSSTLDASSVVVSECDDAFALEPVEVVPTIPQQTAETQLEIPAFLLAQTPPIPEPHNPLFPLDFSGKAGFDTRNSKLLTF